MECSNFVICFYIALESPIGRRLGVWGCCVGGGNSTISFLLRSENGCIIAHRLQC